MGFDPVLLNIALFWLLTIPHEFAHAWVATKLGDDTPLREDRVTLNPMAHVDWLGTVLLPAISSLSGAGFLGWGKPVNTNPRKLWRGMTGMAVVALAGPFSNVILAILLAAVAAVTTNASPGVSSFAARGVRMSIYLALFNLIPVPPLDGSKVLLAAHLPVSIYNALARYGFILLILAMVATGLGIYLSSWSVQASQALFALFR